MESDDEKVKVSDMRLQSFKQTQVGNFADKHLKAVARSDHA